MSALILQRKKTGVAIALVSAMLAVALGFTSNNPNSRPFNVDARSSFASRAYDSDTDSFRRLKYKIDATHKWSGVGSRTKRRRRSGPLSLSSNPISNFVDRASSFLATLTEEQEENAHEAAMDEQRKNGVGKVMRTAARENQGEKSRPGRPGYTTRKDSKPFIDIDTSGVVGDYNHYRTIALESTPDRAVSILTSDVLAYVRDDPIFSRLSDGDLGENILIEQLSYSFFEIGKRYKLFSKEEGGADGAIIEVTEPAVPCANLCNLPFINTELLEPRQRIEKCQSFIEKLGIDDGFRGWYARVVVPGRIKVGDSIALMA